VKRKARVNSVSSYEIYEVTAYTSGPESTGKRPGDEGYGITTSGNRVKEGLTVSCPQELALGTVIDIEGVGSRECQDRGSAIKGKRLDLYIADLDRALEFGRRTLKVRIIAR
jgi:3D (Asp-Asp-Asp) domain-containing protein